MKRCLCILAAVLLVGLVAAPAVAFDQPSVNLGFTSFLDGGPPAGAGWYFAEYVQYYTADTLADGPPVDPDLDVWVSLNQLLYQSEQPVLWGGTWGLDVIVPVVSIDNAVLPDNGSGLGDILVGPYIQWMKMGEAGPKFMHRVELQMLVPTGKYDNTAALNPGSNFFSFNPYWSGTYFFSPKLTASCRLHYLWNAKNSDPFIGLPGSPSETQAGQAIHANLSAAYELMPNRLRAGVNAYFFKQISDSEYDGVAVAGKEQVFGIGPGLLYSFSQDSHLFCNLYFETGAEYRPEGERINLRFVHHF